MIMVGTHPRRAISEAAAVGPSDNEAEIISAFHLMLTLKLERKERSDQDDDRFAWPWMTVRGER